MNAVSSRVIAVTDGEASHPQSDTFAPRRALASIRAHESDEALRRLGWKRPDVTRLHCPTESVAARRDELSQALADLLLPDDLCVAPWTGDGHPDHDATAEPRCALVERWEPVRSGYLVWAWHWADPEGADIPWDRVVGDSILGRTRRVRVSVGRPRRSNPRSVP